VLAVDHDDALGSVGVIAPNPITPASSIRLRRCGERTQLAGIVKAMQNLDSEQRLRLLKLVCTMAWADDEVQYDEKGFIAKLMFQLKMPAAEIRQVKQWLASPPEDDVKVEDIPPEHRAMFLQVCHGVLSADGVVTDQEKQALARIEALLGGG
jgi:uncharacterized tellurite resistance protein B-like protein